MSSMKEADPKDSGERDSIIVAEVARVVSKALNSHTCFSQMMWLCWLLQAMTSSVHWSGLLISVKRPLLRLAPVSEAMVLDLKKANCLLWVGVSLCLKRRSLGTS
ncbi:hypothetical protein AMECASPLE_036393 [Ameca splendens]|uniref:Uncharacterized protein n=1 Tax=Ameca splendens TaxID=208324 RepID=A0ABV0Z6I4_9TELE